MTRRVLSSLVKSTAIVGCVYLSVAGICAAQDRAVSNLFLSDLSTALLGQPGPFVKVNDGQGWRGVLLAQPGSSTAAITEAYNGLPGDLAQSLANASVFDRPVQVSGGAVVFGARPLHAAWNEILEDARPAGPLPRDRLLQTAVMKWLFKPILKKRKVVGYTREPSQFVLAYQKFESMYSQLVRGKESQLWRLDARLKRFATYEQAQANVLSEWMKEPARENWTGR
jgi:hypothetical protein